VDNHRFLNYPSLIDPHAVGSHVAEAIFAVLSNEIVEISMNKRLRLACMCSALSLSLAACGTGGDDNAACDSFIESAAPVFGEINDFARNWREREGSRAGMEAALKAGESLFVISQAASASAELASRAGKKKFEVLAETSGDAAKAVPIRGGSMGDYESSLMIQFGDDISAINDFCEPFEE